MTYTPEEGAQIFKRDAMGRVRLPRARREELLNEYERSGISGVQFAAYVGIKYSTLASWIQKRERRRGQQEKSLIRAESGLHSDKGNGTWVEAVIERGPEPKAPQGSLRIYFNGGAYCQITWFEGSPFRGLLAFQPEHALVFFGRDLEIREVVDLLVKQSVGGKVFLMILGMSGCGKSSLARAGVLPAMLQPGAVPGVEAWRWR